MTENKINMDLVYTWVDGADAEYLTVCQRYANHPIDTNPERYRDIYEMLKYSLRSVDKYLECFGNIYIVTVRPQIPHWLNTTHPRIKIVHHDEIIDSQYLPTFNPNCIESFIHRIPNLSEHFLYSNDDFLFGSKTTLEDFMPRGKYRVFNSLMGENLGWRIYDGKNDGIGLGIIEHTPLFIKKQFWNEMTTLFPEKMHLTRNNKFRKPEGFDDLQTVSPLHAEASKENQPSHSFGRIAKDQYLPQDHQRSGTPEKSTSEIRKQKTKVLLP